MKPPTAQPCINFWRWTTAGLFILAGANHFWHPAFYQRVMPPFLPWPASLVALSGAFEIAGGLGLLIPPLRRTAAWGLIALLLAVFPANIQMVIAPETAASLGAPLWTLWARLPLQAVLIWWVWRIALRMK